MFAPLSVLPLGRVFRTSPTGVDDGGHGESQRPRDFLPACPPRPQPERLVAPEDSPWPSEARSVRQAISETKRFVDVASLPPDFEIAPEWDVCLASIMRPAAQKRIQALMAQGFHKPGDVEERLGHYVGQVGR